MKKESVKKDQYTVVLEDLRSDFKVFGEALMGVDDKVNNLDKKVDNLKKELKQEMEIVKGELSIIRHNQVTRDEFQLLKNRVLKLEQKVK